MLGISISSVPTKVVSIGSNYMTRAIQSGSSKANNWMNTNDLAHVPRNSRYGVKLFFRSFFARHYRAYYITALLTGGNWIYTARFQRCNKRKVFAFGSELPPDKRDRSLLSFRLSEPLLSAKVSLPTNRIIIAGVLVLFASGQMYGVVGWLAEQLNSILSRWMIAWSSHHSFIWSIWTISIKAIAGKTVLNQARAIVVLTTLMATTRGYTYFYTSWPQLLATIRVASRSPVVAVR